MGGCLQTAQQKTEYPGYLRNSKTYQQKTNNPIETE